MRITTGSPPPRDGQTPILSTSIQPSPAAHADLPHQSPGSDSFRKDFLPLLILLLLKTPENEGMLKQVSPSSRKSNFTVPFRSAANACSNSRRPKPLRRGG